MEADPVIVDRLAAGFDQYPEAQSPPAYLVVVHKGPTWERGDIEPFCRLLSQRFAGEVWAFGPYTADVLVGRVRLRVVEDRPLQKTANLLRFIRHVVVWIEQLRTARMSKLAIVSLEPFTGGLLALYTASRARGVFICEINGVYASRHNAIKTRIGLVAATQMLVRRLVGGFVLRHATAVRLLFPNQLQGFKTLPRNVVSRQFFELANLSVFHPGAEEPVILGIGFPFLVKGFDILCRAFMRISHRFPHFKLVLIGYRVPEEVQQRGFGHPRIQSYPGLSHSQVAEWMARCAIFALPSRTEAMGRVLLEAAAAGKCRVAANVDGIPTVINDGVDGLLVDAENVDQLAAVLERLICDENLRRRLGDAAKMRVHQEFSDDAYLDHYEDLVSAALRRRVR